MDSCDAASSWDVTRVVMSRLEVWVSYDIFQFPNGKIPAIFGEDLSSACPISRKIGLGAEPGR
jgi:hypothetical protein